MSSLSCLEQCQAMKGCAAASFDDDAVCRLYTSNAAAPKNCPIGSTPIAGVGSQFLEPTFRVKYQGEGTDNTRCWTNTLSSKQDQALPQAMVPAQLSRRWTGPSTNSSGVSLKTCKERCMLDLSCIAVSYLVPNRLCRMHTTLGTSTQDIDAVSLTKCNTPLTKACPVNQGMSVFWVECSSSSAIGGTLSEVRAVTFDECKNECDPLVCVGIQWDPASRACSIITTNPLPGVDSTTNFCRSVELDASATRIFRPGIWLDGGPISLCAVSTVVRSSGMQSETCCTSEFWYLPNHGAMMQQEGMSWKASDLCSCATMCQEDMKCVSFTWDQSTGLCYLIDPSMSAALRKPIPRPSSYYFTRKTEGGYAQMLDTSCVHSSMTLSRNQTLSACLADCSASSWCRAVVHDTSGPTLNCQLVFAMLSNASFPCRTVKAGMRNLYVKPRLGSNLPSSQIGKALSNGQVRLGSSPMTLSMCKQGCMLSNCAAFRCDSCLCVVDI